MRLLSLACIVVAALPFLCARWARAGEAIPYDHYVTLIERIEAAARQRTSLGRLALELGAVTTVRLPDGTVVPVDNHLLLSGMRQADSPAEYDAVAKRAAALLAELRAAQPVGVSPELTDSMTSLGGVLSDPALQRPIVTPTPRSNEPQRPPNLELPRINGDVIRLVLAIAGGAGVIFLIVALGPTLFRFFASRRPRLRGEPVQTLEVATSAEAVERAQQASAIQDYRLAVRMLYLASLLKLDESGALRYERTQTNREYVRQVAAQPALANALRPVVEVFDDVWYGFRPITPEGYGEFEARVADVLRLAVRSQ